MWFGAIVTKFKFFPALFNIQKNVWPSFQLFVQSHHIMPVAVTEMHDARALQPDPGLHGLWIVITPTATLHIGDLVRVLWQEFPICAQGYLFRRAGSSMPLLCRRQADALAVEKKLVMDLPSTHLFAIHIPLMLPQTDGLRNEMEPFLVRAPHLVPYGGWAALLQHAGVGTRFTEPRSWQFFGHCWDPDSTLTGKTGGLHMSLHETTRRCQLLVEYGVCGDSLVHTLPHTKQGVLMYISNMNTDDAARSGDVCHESSLSLSFSALLLAYAETLSIVRRAVYEHPTHPYGGVDYPAREWDYTHTPYSKPFPVASPACKPLRTVNIAAFASKKAELWIRAEVISNPAAWAPPPTLEVDDVHVGMKMPLRLWHPGVTQWVSARVTHVDTNEGVVSFDVPLTPHCLGMIGSRVVFVH